MNKSGLRKTAKDYFAAKEAGKLSYRKADSLMEIIANKLKPGDEIDLGNGTKARFIDPFAGKGHVWVHAAAHRWELEIVKA